MRKCKSSTYTICPPPEVLKSKESKIGFFLGIEGGASGVIYGIYGGILSLEDITK